VAGAIPQLSSAASNSDAAYMVHTNICIYVIKIVRRDYASSSITLPIRFTHQKLTVVEQFCARLDILRNALSVITVSSGQSLSEQANPSGTMT
jgi:hypothetical protein